MKSLRHQFDTLMVLALIGIVPALFYYLIVHKTIFLGLSWNIFLGLLPFYFAIKANAASHKITRWFSAGLWLLFLPNAPYLITDLVHIHQNRGYQGFVFYLVAVLSFTGLLSWLFSVRIMLARLPGILRQWKIIRVYGYGLLCILSGIGVAMGRFARLNSWEMLYEPWNIVKSTIIMYTHFWPWIITLLIACFLYLVGFAVKPLSGFRKMTI